MSTVTIGAYRPGRNSIGLGDPVRCRPTHGRPFTGTVLAIRADESTGAVLETTVVEGANRRRSVRTLRPEGISRVAKSSHEPPPSRR